MVVTVVLWWYMFHLWKIRCSGCGDDQLRVCLCVVVVVVFFFVCVCFYLFIYLFIYLFYFIFFSMYCDFFYNISLYFFLVSYEVFFLYI